MKIYQRLLVSILLTLSGRFGRADEADGSWSFIVMADWHGAESFAVDPVNDTRSDNIYYRDMLEVLKYINLTHGGDLVMLPGDTNDGKWHREEFRKNLKERLGYTSLTANEGIAIGGQNCYSTTKRLFAESGYDKILVTIGDHELGKDIQCSTFSHKLHVF